MQRRITIEYRRKDIDIEIDSGQKIKTTLKVISESKREFRGIEEVKDIRLKKSGRQIGKEKTYEEEGIYSGEIIRCE